MLFGARAERLAHAEAPWVVPKVELSRHSLRHRTAYRPCRLSAPAFRVYCCSLTRASTQPL